MDTIPLRLPFILDGATGTKLREHGMPDGACVEQWVLAHPDTLIEIQKKYVMAGSDIIYAPTFGANRAQLGKHGLGDSVAEYNHSLVEISKRAADGKALVAGGLSSAGVSVLSPIRDDFEELVGIFAEQGRALDASGVDLFAVETMTSIVEARAAVIALREVSDKPIMVSFTVDENGRTLSGSDILAAYVIMQGLGAAVFGLNCSSGPDSMIENLRKLAPYATIPIMVKPSAGLPTREDGKERYPIDAEEFGMHVREWAAAGARIFGGCCGTNEKHIAALRAAVDEIDFSRFGKPALDDDTILCSTEKTAQFISVTIDVSEPIECSHYLAADILEAEETPTGAIKISIRSEDDLVFFNESQYMIRDALCLHSDSPELLERALRLYNGRAFYDGTGDVDDSILKDLENKYGLVIL